MGTYLVDILILSDISADIETIALFEIYVS